MNRIMRIGLSGVLLLCVMNGLAFAEVKPAAVFSDRMVLQRDAAVPVWGTADAGEKVAVSFGGQIKETVAGADGRWMVKLDPMPASAEPRDLDLQSSIGNQKSKIGNVLVGDVWLCAGGLNTAISIANLPDAAAAAAGIKAATPAPLLRIFAATLNTAKTVQPEVKGRWLTVAAGSANSLNAEGYYLGSNLVSGLNVPVGIVVTAMAWPGQPIETWMSREALSAWPAAQPILEYYDSDNWKNLNTGTYEERLKAWMDICQKLPLNPPPKPQPNDAKSPRVLGPGSVWNAMVAPLMQFAIRGVVWDHGEDDGSMQRAVQYGQLLPGMIASWRQEFGNPELPFVVVQHRPRNDSFPHGGRDGRLAAELRDAQRTAAAEAKASLAVTIDLGKDPHPREVCPRIVNTILARVYKKEGLSADGPEVSEVETVGNKVILHFRNTQGGLVARGGALKGFTIASSMFRWVWADAEIKGDTIVVSAPTVDKPEGVRYAWQDLPEQGANLYNGAGCPASPFRTDKHLLCSATTVKPGVSLGYNRRIDIGIENPRLPRVLIIGDSISGHYLDSVRDGLHDRANVIGEASMGKEGTWASMGPRFYRSDWASKDDNLKNFLKERGPFDIVHFNNGIHNFARAKPGDEKPYAEQLRKVVATIRESGSICLFANSTGTIGDNKIPNSPNYLTNCKAFNAAAEAVMRELNVPVTDMYGALQPRIEELISADLIHPKTEANPIMAKVIIERIDEALALKKWNNGKTENVK